MREKSSHRTQTRSRSQRKLAGMTRGSGNLRKRRGFVVKVAICSVVAVLLVFKPYSKWKSEKFTALAGQSLTEGNPERAALEARVAMKSNEANREAKNKLAEAYEALNDPRLLAILEELSGEKGNMRYTRAALSFGEVDLAQESLASFSPGDEERVEYFQLGTYLAERTSDGAALFRNLESLALATDRTTAIGASALLKLGGLTALSQEYKLSDDLRLELERWAQSDDEQAIDANVILWTIESRTEGDADQNQWLKSMLIAPEDTPEIAEHKGDALLRAMDFATAFEDDSWIEMFDSARDWAANHRSPLLVGRFLQWLQRHQHYEQMVESASLCSKSLMVTVNDSAETIRAVILGRILVADACARENDWQGVGRWCEGGEWGDYEYLRSLMIARALSGGSTDTIPVPAQRWLGLAIGQALDDPGKLESLEKASQTYGPRGLWVELHRRIAARALDRRTQLKSWAILKQTAIQTGNLFLFREATERLAEMIPNNWPDEHNALFAASLMEVVPASTVDSLSELLKKNPGNPDIITSLALAQSRTGDAEAALETVALLSESEQTEPGVAPFCAIVYGLAGQKIKSKEFADLPAELHFPESHRLLMAAKSAAE